MNSLKTNKILTLF